MAVGGAKPKEDRSQIRHRVPPTTEWTEVENVPHEGGPDLPTRSTVTGLDGVLAGGGSDDWPQSTKQWWRVIRRMPHAKLWTDADWQYAMATAETHARFVEAWKGCVTGAELRQREKLMGVYWDARRDLRIRYVEPKPEGTGNADVVQLSDFRGL